MILRLVMAVGLAVAGTDGVALATHACRLDRPATCLHWPPRGVTRLTCRDGGPPGSDTTSSVCRNDEPGDGRCTFSICESCGTLPCVCDAARARSVSVAVGERQVLRWCPGRRRVVLRCRPPRPCDEAHACFPVVLRCRDGVTGPATEGQCDVDGRADGVCTFGFFCSEVCGGLVDTAAVPAGATRTIVRGNLPRLDVTQYTLGCE